MTILYYFSVKYRKHLKNELGRSSRFQCEECTEILLEPYQTECGFRYCYPCVYKLDNQKTCPGCSKEIESFQKNINYDRAIEKEILKQKVSCINSECAKNLTVKELKDHEGDCDYRKHQCTFCDETYLHTYEKEHLEKECKKVLRKCESCDIELTREILETVHRNINGETFDNLCPKWRRTCPYQCCDTIFDSVKLHLATCIKRPVRCMLWKMGCKMVTADERMNEHIKTNEIHHAELLTKFLLQARSTNRNSQSQLWQSAQIFSDNAEAIKQSTLKATNQISQSSVNILNHSGTIKSLKDEFSTIKNARKNDSVLNKSSWQEMSPSNTVEYIWTVTDIRQKIIDAKQNNSLTQVLSEPFYLRRPGYRIRLKIYPNGDGTGKNVFLSAFFVIMKGDHDNTLQWPFNKRVRLCVLKDGHEVPSTTIRMRPDYNESCYGRPTNEHNVAAGQPNFVNINQLLNEQRLISNGSLQIRFTMEL